MRYVSKPKYIVCLLICILYRVTTWIDTQLEKKNIVHIMQPDKKRIALFSSPLVRFAALTQLMFVQFCLYNWRNNRIMAGCYSSTSTHTHFDQITNFTTVSVELQSDFKLHLRLDEWPLSHTHNKQNKHFVINQKTLCHFNHSWKKTLPVSHSVESMCTVQQWMCEFILVHDHY